MNCKIKACFENINFSKFCTIEVSWDGQFNPEPLNILIDRPETKEKRIQEIYRQLIQIDEGYEYLRGKLLKIETDVPVFAVAIAHHLTSNFQAIAVHDKDTNKYIVIKSTTQDFKVGDSI